ncbi:ComEC/Rec2 family competence protein [Parvibaculum sp.]|uniref:ComEC/Rec2 family competence protein n=1 Tax=Parvibaculum sp. TaxID=2024848 RepID=UPI00320C545B
MTAATDAELEEAVEGPPADEAFSPLRRASDYVAASFFGETDRWFLWSPVLLGLGIALYFSLSFEPPLWAALLALSAAGGGLAVALRRGATGVLAVAIFCVVLGFALACIRAAVVAAPVIQKPWNGVIEGRVVEVERTEKGALAVTLEPLSMDRVAPADMPAKVRLQVRFPDAVIEPGETIRVRGRLMPPPEPVEPGGFDYARQVWFDGLGGVGFAFAAPERVAPPPEDWTTSLARLRQAITARVQSGIGGASGAIAAALITGEQRAIPDWAAEDLRKAGLAHVLSISGLHMVLFGGSLFWLLRAGLALVPAIALRYPIKKWGAAAALVGSTGYLLISGAEVATQRSWIMIALMFVAIIFDRPALSMRNVALAALLVLAWQPESLLGASFQMSFAAVVGLIACYESPLVQRFTAMNEGSDGFLFGSLRFAFNYVAGVLVTTTIAGFATGAYAAFHFDRIALYGMAGNLGALPIVSVLVMPAALATMVLMPFGAEAPALWVMGKGVEGMLWVAHEVAGWRGADRLVASAPMASLALLTLGGLWLSLWRGSWRFAGIAPMALALALWGSPARPDLLIAPDGRLAALRGKDGLLHLTAKRSSYAASQWLRHDGDTREPSDAVGSPYQGCDSAGCIWHEPGRPLVAFSEGPEALGDDCVRADVVISMVPVARQIRATCHARLVVDRFDLWRGGAIAIYYGSDGTMRMETSREARGRRPWVQRQFTAKSRDEGAADQ